MSDLIQLLESRSTKTPSGCWEWTGARIRGGYGEVNRNGGPAYVHRLAWAHYNGPIPAGLHVLHRCDNPPCWNPEHLFLGTNQDNVDDKIAKGRLRHGHLCGDQHPARAHPETFLRYGEEHHGARLTWAKVRKIRKLYERGKGSTELARLFAVSRGAIDGVISGKNWRE